MPLILCSRESTDFLSTHGELVFYHVFHSSRGFLLCTVFFLFTELDDVFQHLRQCVPLSGPHVADTSDTSADESEASYPRHRLRSKCAYKEKKMWGADEVGRFLVTGPTDAPGKPCYFYCRICHKDVSVLTHGSYEVLRHFQGVKYFARDQRLRLETPGWQPLDFEGNPLCENELERQRERILRDRLVIRDREYLYTENLIVDYFGAPDATLPVFAKVSSLIEMFRLGGPYGVV